jgi:hypothetical protein
MIHVNAVDNIGANTPTNTISCFENEYFDSVNTELSGGRESSESAANNYDGRRVHLFTRSSQVNYSEQRAPHELQIRYYDPGNQMCFVQVQRVKHVHC